jgi:hypothetical protein
MTNAMANTRLNHPITFLEFIRENAGNQYYLHFSNHPLLSMNETPSHSSPTGIYAYQLNDAISDQLLSRFCPYAGERKFCYAFRCSKLVLDTQEYSMPELARHFSELIGMDVFSATFDKIVSDSRVKTPGSYLWTLATKYCGGKSPQEIFSRIGYSGVQDELGVIHKHEPIQSVFFNRSSLVEVKRFNLIQDPTSIEVKSFSRLKTILESLPILSNRYIHEFAHTLKTSKLEKDLPMDQMTYTIELLNKIKSSRLVNVD